MKANIGRSSGNVASDLSHEHSKGDLRTRSIQRCGEEEAHPLTNHSDHRALASHIRTCVQDKVSK